MTQPVHLIGIDPAARAKMGGFSEYLIDSRNRESPSFTLREDVRDRFEALHPIEQEVKPRELPPLNPNAPPPPEPTPVSPRDPKGVYVGWGMSHYRSPRKMPDGTTKHEDIAVLNPGDVINILTIGAGKDHVEPVSSPFVVADMIKTDMTEYDSKFVYVDLAYLQQLRGMNDRVTHLQIKLKDYSKAAFVVQALRDILLPQYYQVATWEMKQGAILGAIDVERGILNILLFLIVGVAGFSILAIFTMIVSEKTRDIGILKSMGASNRGIMSIFVGYGLLLGFVGCLFGTALGLEFTYHINDIEKWLTSLTGKEVFPREVYYFDEIPTNISISDVLMVNLGAMISAVMFSVLPALRAATLRPVRALRSE